MSRKILSIALLLAVVVFLQLRSRGEAVPPRQPLETMSGEIGGWQSRGTTLFGLDVLDVLRPSDYVMREYVDGHGRQLWLFIGYWEAQRRGAAPHSPKNCLPGSGWEPLEASLLTIPVAGGAGSITVNRYLIQKDRDQELVLYWYQEQGQAIAGEIAAKIQMVKMAIARNRTDGALIRVSAPVRGGVAPTAASLTAFVQALYPRLGDYLPE